ncbi:MAG: Mrp/NBP35 family ATP-binding protein [Planctomycetota bacterium]
MTIDLLRTALNTVQDPDLFKGLVDLNMVRNLRIDGSVASFDLVLTTGACPAKKQLEDESRAAALTVPGVREAKITISAEVPLAKTKTDLIPGVRHVIAVGSGKGGVGKSTVTVNLACALAQLGARVGLIDADIHGPSVPMMLGHDQQPNIVDKKLVPPIAHGVRFISMGLLIPEGQAVVWRGPMLQGALRQFFADVSWGELDYLLIDLPPGTGDVQISLASLVSLAGAVIVSTPQSVALLDARRAVTMFNKVNVPILGVVENMSDFVCPECGHVSPIFGHGGAEAEAKIIGAPFLGRIPLEPAVRACGDEGEPIVVRAPHSLSGQAFRAVAGAVAARASTLALSEPSTT